MRNQLIVVAILLATGSAFAQQQEKAPQPGPAVLVAVRALEEKKDAAGKAFNEAQQQEQQVFQEFAQDHPGYAIDPSTLKVIKLPPPQVTQGKPEVKK